MNAEHRYRAVLEVADGVSVIEVLARYGVLADDLHLAKLIRWIRSGRFLGGSRRQRRTPNRVEADVEALICEIHCQRRH